MGRTDAPKPMAAGRHQVLCQRRTWLAATCTVLLIMLATLIHSGEAADPVPEPEQVAWGRRLYLDGTLGPGQPLTGRVQDDVALTAQPAACVHCHQRSGLGTAEGTILVPAITGPALAQATPPGPRQRPAYSDATLLRAIREGVDAAGQPLHPLMPRYVLPDAAASALVAYLKTLSAHWSPGVSEQAVYFATVVTEDVAPARRQAMLDVLNAYVMETNAGRALASGSSHGPSQTRSAAGSMRAWVLSPWTLTGPPTTWPAQLDAYYRAQPVFAVLSGISASDWRPVHEFCERHEVPCLLPNTALPVLTTTDFYTLYLSRGLALEAEALAAYLSRGSSPVRLLQVFRRDLTGQTASSALRRAFVGIDTASVVDWVLEGREPLSPEALAARLAATQSTAAVLWLPREGWVGLGAGRWPLAEPVHLYLSSTLLNGELAAVPETLRRLSSVIHPFSPQRRIRRLEGWLGSHGLALIDQPVQAQTYLAGLIASEGLKRVGERLYRDYFLEVIDRLAMAPMGSGFPHPDFAPSRRYLINGAYILEVGEGDGPPIQSALWIGP